ncbi:uncharacterized protein LOC143618892 [Bidens hawaiensis]|uniref:uncharacterized protein LOC143618892 n=1 Tax=Bidens hawaiensis TaxID=980011 RepID=UPI004049837A
MTMLTATLITLFSLLTCVMAVTLTYAIASDYFTSCFDPKARWMQVGLLEFLTDLSLIIAWYFYKESRWILRVIFIFLTFWFGSFIICGYIILEIFKLSPEESSKDPIKFVLVKRHKRDAIGHTWRVFVVTTRTILILLACLMLGSLVFVFTIKGSPFHAEVLSPYVY